MNDTTAIISNDTIGVDSINYIDTLFNKNYLDMIIEFLLNRVLIINWTDISEI